ncbi:hypothetical protein CC80DRAFT_486717 [Byssothecium circinans]|uniref:Zn(2)-C6 fungal-type domain-containing protein n=1 Tax=Byssothecium circinans TaxID=147558 RepID=A0A6A5UDP4_9PLEO|nr:hypothetical protein CC80DRAFT_486717 [Byssothecium circinans]
MQAQTSILEFPSLKKTRRYGAKVKTGCNTCKFRRIRCDEGKPSCQKCTASGRHCEGYAQDRKTTKLNQIGILDLTQASVIRHSLPIPSVPTLTVSSDGLQYLEFYHHCAEHMASEFDGNFWGRIAPQMAQSEPSVRHALIALGYLNRSETGTIKNAAHSLTGEDRRGLLFYHYNKAVRHLIERINEASYTPEIGLVTCLLFICIEFLRANFHTAFQHLYNGLKVISEWHQGLSKDRISTRDSVPSISEITRTAFESGTTMTEIVPMFFRTITCALLFGVEIEKIIGMPVIETGAPELRPFFDIHEARTASLEAQNAVLAFLRDTAPRSFPPPKIRPKTQRLQQRLLRKLESWWRAFQNFEKNTHLTPKELVMAAELKAGFHCLYIAAACVLSVVQAPYDAHLQGFKAMNAYIKFIFDSKGLPKRSPPPLTEPLMPKTSRAWTAPSRPPPPTKPAANFKFEVMMLPLLYFTLTRCRCPITRREALAQMERGAPREALWDYDQHALVSRRVIEIEEEVVDPTTGWPVEDARLWCAVVEGAIHRDGGFWVNFAKSTWVLEGAIKHEIALGGAEEEEEYPGFRKRGDNQWQEWFQL